MPTGIDALLIETATSEHVPYLVRLKQQVMESRYRPAHGDAEFERWRSVYCTEEYFHGLLASDRSLVLSVGNLREPAGMVVLHDGGDHLEVDDLLVLNPRRRVGTRLIEAALAYAQAWRRDRVVVDVYPGHDIVERFLTAHGFQQTGDSANDLGRPMHRWERNVDA